MKKFFQDINLLWKSLPLAKRFVLELNADKHVGVVKFQIAYQKIRQALIKECGIAHSDITGSIAYLALSIQAWRYSK